MFYVGRIRMGLVGVFATVLCRPLLVASFGAKLPVALGRPSIATGVSVILHQSKNNLMEFMGNAASSLFGVDQIAVPANSATDEKLDNIVVSWESMRQQLHEKQTEDERSFRDNLGMGHGAASPLHKIRLYDTSNKEEDIRVVFYRDSASWCPYCQKVWICLEEKKIPYRIEKVNMRCYGSKPKEFTRMQPSGQIPVAVIDGVVYGQSDDILRQLESKFPDAKSLSPPEHERTKAQELLRLERQLFSAWMYWLTSSGDPDRFQAMFTEVLQKVECALTDGPFFLGKTVGIVDIMFAPFLERMAASLLYYKGFQIRVAPKSPIPFPNINRWFEAMEMLDSYMLTKSDYYTHCWDLPPQLGGCVSEAKGAPYRAAINGERNIDRKQGSWELPLLPDNGGVEPDWSKDDAAAKREAVERLTANPEAIVRFAARGAGRVGVPPVMAPLADPNATPNDAVLVTVDCILRLVCLAILESPSKASASLEEMICVIDTATASGAVNSLAYLRDRVGVPRDMKLPAARQLRAHLNWSIGKILDAHPSL